MGTSSFLLGNCGRSTTVDCRARLGTLSNYGIVLVARRLFFEGNCVAIDRGQGLMIRYMHLSKFKIRRSSRFAVSFAKYAPTMRRGQMELTNASFHRVHTM
jgi:hypothetical protein